MDLRSLRLQDPQSLLRGNLIGMTDICISPESQRPDFGKGRFFAERIEREDAGIEIDR